jgi:hypothetical protein
VRPQTDVSAAEMIEQRAALQPEHLNDCHEERKLAQAAKLEMEPLVI